MPVRADDCAREVLEVVPLLMHSIRTEMRNGRRPDLSVPQFRALMFLSRHGGASLSLVAEHLGQTPPSTSRLVEGLVARGLIDREPHPRDRRRVTLALTPGGRAALEAARTMAQECLARLLASLPPGELATVRESMRVLRPVFTIPCGGNRRRHE